MSARTPATARSMRREVEVEGLLDEDAQHADRRAAQAEGILVPVGFWPIAKMPASVSSLSARASATPVGLAGSSSPAARGR